MKWIISLALLTVSCLVGTPSVFAESQHEEVIKDIDEILTRFRIPGAAIAVVDQSGIQWQHIHGFADIESQRRVTEDTLFRQGSVSKMLVGMAVMQLVEQGQLSLRDKVADLAPEIPFNNPWEPRQPVRLWHLLGHAAGWDAPKFRNQWLPGTEPKALAEILKRSSDSLTSRWHPGSRVAYNNIGPVAAAYIIEQISGQSFEDYVQQNLLNPLDIQASYFYDDAMHRLGATGYKGGRPQPYYHAPLRPAGALNASLTDMAKLTQMLINRGAVAGTAVLQDASLLQMEKPYGTLAAEIGLTLGYGLGNMAFRHEHLILQGHQGALPGNEAMLMYSPKLKLGYVIMMNTNSPAMAQLYQVLSQHLAAQLTDEQPQPKAHILPPDIFGIYKSVSPIKQAVHGFASLLPMQIVPFNDGVAIKPLLGGKPRPLVFNAGVFKEPLTGETALVRGTDPLVGKVIHYGPQTLQKVSALNAYLPLVIALLWLLVGLSVLLFTLVWLPRRLRGKIPKGASIQIRLWPLLSMISLLASLVIARNILTGPEYYKVVAAAGPKPLLLLLMTLIYGACSILAVVQVVRFRPSSEPGQLINRWAYRQAASFAALNALVCLFLLSQGAIGLRLWAL